MKLPDKFQFRVKDESGYTHTAKFVGNEYKVKWARGFESYFMEKHNLSRFGCGGWSNYSVQRQMECGNWIIVNEKAEQKKQEDALPDEFYFKVLGEGATYRMTLVGDEYRCTVKGSPVPPQMGVPHIVHYVKAAVKHGAWVVVNVLTAEQQRANKELREQIEALNSSIRISEQSVEHQNRLQANYRERIEQLKQKIVEE